MPDPAMPPPPEAPVWLDRTTLRAMEAARDHCLSHGADAAAAAEAAAAVARAHHPALPARMIGEAAAAVMPPAPTGRR